MLHIPSPTSAAVRWLADFADTLAREDIAATMALFADECFWRDMVAFTWNIKTMEGKDAIADFLQATLANVRPSDFRIGRAVPEPDGGVAATFTFETRVARGEGILRLKENKCWTLLTVATELKGHEEKKGTTRDKGVVHGVHMNRKTWLERKTQDEAELGTLRQPYCVIVGGGQGGIALGARLKRLGVATIILEKNERAGDSWRRRYKSLCLHDPVWYDHMPYLPFPKNWPVFSPKDKIGDWLEMYTKVMELNYWGSTECKRACYDDAKKEWTVEVVREGKPMTLQPRHLVLATGSLGVPNMPSVPGMERFQGDLHHSSKHPGPDGYRGKK